MPAVDTGMPAVDTGMPAVDTGMPAVDTGMPAVDTGMKAKCDDPRVLRSKAAVLSATVQLLREVGLGGLTIEGIAARSGVAKTTIYRHWADRDQLAFESIESIMDAPLLVPTGDLGDDLRTAMAALVEGLASASWAEVLPTMIDAAERDVHVLALAREFAARRRAGLERRLESALDTAELPAGTDVELLVSQLVGPLFYRRFVSRQAIGAMDVVGHVDILLRGVGHPAPPMAPVTAAPCDGPTAHRPVTGRVASAPGSG